MNIPHARLTRRRLLASGLALPLIARQAEPARKLKVVVTGGHPGDPEYGCGGTVARYTDAGHDVVLLYLNKGEKGCSGMSHPDCGALRMKEADKACAILKARPLFASQSDGESIVSPARYDEFRDQIAAEKADVLITQWPIDSHPDHRAISSLTYNAWLRLGKKAAFYFYEVSDGEDTQMFAPTDYVDISMTADRKRQACFAHASQTPDRYYDLQHKVTAFRGVQSGHAEAEAYVRHVGSPAGLP